MEVTYVEPTPLGEIMRNGQALDQVSHLTCLGSTFSSGDDEEKESNEMEQTYVAGEAYEETRSCFLTSNSVYLIHYTVYTEQPHAYLRTGKSLSG